MARVTIEDCIKVVPSRFELVVLGAQRTREIASYGQDATTEKRHNKEVVTALREIATGFVSPDALRESIIKKHQNKKFISEVDVVDEAEDGFGDEIAETLASLSVAVSSSSISDEEDDGYSEEMDLSEDVSEQDEEE